MYAAATVHHGLGNFFHERGTVLKMIGRCVDDVGLGESLFGEKIET